MTTIKHITQLSFLLIAFLFTGCSKTETSTEGTTEESSEQSENSLTLTEEQAKIVQITTTEPEMRIMSDEVKATGMLDVPPQNMVTIAAPLGGFVSETTLLQGARVRKGETIVKLRHPNYIQLQQDYLESVSQLNLTTQELDRQESLAKENINSQKTLQQARADQGKAKARHQALAATLRLIHLDGKSLEKEGIRDEITIPSPISGFVTKVDVNLGMFVAPEQSMFRIVDTEHLHAELHIFEKDILKIKKGQKIRFRLANENQERTASVYLVGKEISEDRTVRVHGHLDKHDNQLMPGMFLSAVIETGTGEIASLPEKCFVSFEGADYIFLETGTRTYEMTSITKGSCSAGYCAFAFEGGEKKGKIVVDGTDILLGSLKNSEE